ncbi:MAG: peptide ABC transporter substrate-binding protein [Pseudomonadota bacterium]
MLVFSISSCGLSGLARTLMRLCLLLVIMSSAATSSAASTGDRTTVGGYNESTGTLVLPLAQEPRTLNTLTAESVGYTAQLLAHVQEGLMRYDRRRQLAGGVAESWKLTPDSMQFVLRADAKWQNGEPVTALDFVFAWQQLVSPDNASPSANLASPILNASRIAAGELPKSALGVTAVSESELLVRLEHPCAWCLKLMTNPVFYPVHQGFYESRGEHYATAPKDHLANGAYQLSGWERGKNIRLARNKNYWRAGSVAIANLHFDYIGIDAKTALNLFRAGEIAVAGLDRDTIPDALGLGYRIRTFPSGHLFHIQFSHLPGMASANENLRRAISLVVDKTELVNRVVASPGTRVADSMFHDWLTVEDAIFLQARPVTPHRVDLDMARKHLVLARQELGVTGDIELSLTINDVDLSHRVAQYLQAQLMDNLGIRVTIDPQITQIMVNKWRQGVSDMTLITWPVDVEDPMDQISFMGNPDFRAVFRGLYAGDDMAALYLRNRNAVALEERLDATRAVHDLFTERVTVFPLFESYGAVVMNPRLRGFVWQPVRGYADYRYLTIQ